jgi:hypothetical protein
MRAVDILQAFPGILLAIALTAFMGPSIMNIIIALSALGWVGYARVARGQALSIGSSEYILAARAMGTAESRILFRHVMPNLLAPALLVQASFGMASAILAESSLSFLGLGAQDVPSLGKMIYEGTEFPFPGTPSDNFPGFGYNDRGTGVHTPGRGIARGDGPPSTNCMIDMELKEQIGQLFMVGFDGHTCDKQISRMITDYKIGGVILFGRNLAQNPSKIREMLMRRFHQKFGRMVLETRLCQVEDEVYLYSIVVYSYLSLLFTTVSDKSDLNC